MITYLKHVANKKHAELKSKSFEEIQVLYERYKKQDQTFVAIGTEEDERAIKKMNEKAIHKEEEKKDESVHEEVKEEEGAKKRKLGTRRKLKAKRRKHASGLTREDDDLKICLHIAPDEDKVIDVESLNQQYPIIEWQSFFLSTKPQHDQTKPDEDIYLNKLVMEEYKDRLPEGFDRMLWGDLMIMFNQGDTADFWDTQQDWNLISWKLHSSSGVHTIMTSAGLVFHMLVESRYPLTKEVLSQMLELKLETEGRKAPMAYRAESDCETTVRRILKIKYEMTYSTTIKERKNGLSVGKGISNPLMAVMVCQKSYGIQLTNVSSTELKVSPTPAPTRASFHRRTARMTVRAQPAMSYGLSARVTEAMTLYRGTSELILDIDSEGDDFGDEDIKEDEEDKSLDTDDERERLEDEGPGLEGREDEAVPEGEQQAVPVADTIMGEPLGLGYGALRRRELAVEEDQVLSTFEVDPEDSRVYNDIPTYVPPVAHVQTPPSPEWSSGSLPISPSSLLELHGSILHDHTQRLDALPPTLFADIDRDVRDLYTRSGAVRDEICSQRYRFRSLEREQERVAVTFRAL
ncbi:hypothetical protein Tco_0856720 [Tanacetum coccineum]|uniref:Uncharacterized protein n=1 Tax=Tanacetum coccineum TaxID=301880 RepID=A0ABQ5B823_9ASTR